jgi:hypothetical protein
VLGLNGGIGCYHSVGWFRVYLGLVEGLFRVGLKFIPGDFRVRLIFFAVGLGLFRVI